MQPSYQSGFYAPGRGVAKHPELWRGCVGAWNPGLGNTGLSLRDWSSSQNNGTLTGGPTWGVSEGRQALSFDGVDDYAIASVPGAYLSSGFTVSFWATAVFPWGGTTTTRYPLNYGSPENIGFTCQHSSAAYAGVFFMRGNGSYPKIAMSPMPAVNTWVHIVGTWNKLAMELFVNGQSQGTTANTSFGPVSGIDLTIEKGVSGTTVFPGSMSDVSIYNRALSHNEVRTLAQRPGIAYELAPRKFYSLPAAAASSRQYRLFRPSILRGA
jgi:hypothetical protein